MGIVKLVLNYISLNSLQWQASPSTSEKKNKQALEQIRTQQMESKQKLMALEQKLAKLDALIQRAKHYTVASDNEVSQFRKESLALVGLMFDPRNLKSDK